MQHCAAELEKLGRKILEVPANGRLSSLLLKSLCFVQERSGGCTDVYHNGGTKQKLPRAAVSVPEQSQWDCSHKHFGKLSFQKSHFASALCHVVAVPHPCM